MRWFLVGVGGSDAVGLAFRLALHEHFDAAGQAVDLGPMAGDDVGEVFLCADQVGDAFLKVCRPVHRFPFRLPPLPPSVTPPRV